MSDTTRSSETTASSEAVTHCPYCALQCGTRLTRAAGRTAVEPTQFPVNQGGLCQKGWTAPALLDTPGRLTRPLVRGADGVLAPATWEAALDTIAARLREIRAVHGPDAVGVFGGGGLTNEKAYQLGKFARVALGTSQIDYNGRFCMSSAAAAGVAAFGLDRGLPFPVTDLGGADVILLAGANPAETMPPLMRHLNRAALIVIDPRRTPTAEGAALHLQPTPGTDLALALGLFHLAVVEGHADQGYLNKRTTGFDAAWARAAAWWPERVERVTGVPVADMREAVRLLAGAERAYVLTGRGAEQHSKGTDTVAAFINLALTLGLPGRGGSGYGCLTGQGNGQGGREHGQKADQLPGYRMLTDPAARAHVAAVWGVEPDALPGPGRSAYELLDALGTDGGPRALLVFGSNPVVSAPHAARIGERLKSLDLLVVADFVPSETAQLADVVLPVTQWAEEEGTMTNLEGRVLRRRRLLSPPGEARSDLDVLHGLAVRLGQPAGRFATAPREVFEELRRASRGGRADYSGISYERLDAGEALYWPCPQPLENGTAEGAAAHPGTPRLFLDAFAHPDGLARFAEVEHRDGAETPDAAFPLYATTGRVLAQYQSGAQTRRVPELAAAAPEAFVEVHPDTAGRCGLTDGGWARVSSARGSTLARTRLVPSLRTDTVFLPFHFAGAGRANLITSAALDPRSKMPEFKVCAVRIEPAEAGP
ncbi:molybdopterin oxidoreductase family protein [Streptomyces sp. NBC_01443]|uniref:molybdopterin oxidoreductase family protein n=1 Tax=Streptomyces sp. NBC_01443 TaxID=2903868 RepID=UPI00224E372F|nr:molybdopterin oxidoreductase family protein [Streptomyces sp. NBC_01443]MCX4628710.1 molybdopterin oxidoreductase family protein [Streptomyces sp. NBC_01443]WSW44728.1 molybdopterin oxidoreductase family protein [Streptomyces sp. NBC_01001]